MARDVLLIEKKNGVGIMTMNRPERANALNKDLKTGILNALEKLADDDQVGAILLKGAGKHFCAGQDFHDVVLGTDQKDLIACRQAFCHMVVSILDKIVTIGTPVIAATRGMVTGEGLPLAVCCDLIVASENTVFQFPGTNLGGVSIGPAAVAARYIGIKNTLEYLFTGEPIEAGEARRIGLINRVVPDDQLEIAALAFAEKIAGKTLRNPVSIKELGKPVFYASLDMDRAMAIKYAHEALAQIFITPPNIEGAKLFLEGKVSKSDLQLDRFFND